MVDVDVLLKRREVRQSVASCTHCHLVEHCTAPVPFSGPMNPKLVVVGEAPGKQEDETGQPFIGPAGGLLRKHLTHAGWDIEKEVAFVNVVSCFPHRTPTPEEVSACRGNLISQLAFLDASRLLAVGGVAVSALISTPVRMGEVRGTWFRPDRVALRSSQGEVWAFTTWHPSAVLRNNELEWDFGEDIGYHRLMVKYDKAPARSSFCVKCGSPQVTYSSDIPFCNKHKPKAAK